VSQSFSVLCDFPTASDVDLSQELRNLFDQHLGLKNSFRDYFPFPDVSNRWIGDPFNVDVKYVQYLTATEENILELPYDT
jgi:hypothetical protein